MHKTSNICNYYLLPVFKLNISSFGGVSNFVNSYLDYEGKRLIVEIIGKSGSGAYWNHPAYELDYDRDGRTFIVLKFTEEFYDLLDKFKAGKYSHFKTEHKNLIKKYSGLKYKVPSSRDTFVTADKLLALDREVELRQKIEEKLSVRLPEDAELVSVPDEGCFATLKM